MPVVASSERAHGKRIPVRRRQGLRRGSARPRPLAALAAAASIALLALQAAPARAETDGEHVDTEHLFGFTEGSDIGAPPDRELESETTGRFGRRGGSYRAVDSALVVKLPLSESVRVAPGLVFSKHDIAAVPGFTDRDVTAFSGGFFETRTKLARRDEAGFGLTLLAVVGANGTDGLTGLRTRGFTTEAGLLFDREIVPGRLVAAANLVYGFSHADPAGPVGPQHASGLEVSGALAYRIGPGFFLGAEARYLRAYSGLGLERFAGDAVYVGPTLYKELGGDTWLSFTWARQMAGEAVGTPDTLDLTNFDRHQARLRLGTHF